MKARTALALLLIATLAAIAYQVRTTQQSTSSEPLTAYVPQDALLTIESPDFASLLHRWTNSAESKAWLTSDNHAVFQNSRLFGRLTDAQTSFAKTAGIPVTTDLLSQVAGKESVFAWYDIGKLEFLYITRMPAAQAQQSRLFQSRASFERRHAGNADFFLRTSRPDSSTVAFALVPEPSGDLVILATREDLVANALTLIAATAPANSASPVSQEPWFRDASAALPAETPAPVLHMVLNLDRIAVDPHFRSYWIQRNITWTRQFRAAASDMYIESTRFREERVLLPRSPATGAAPTLSITSLAALAPPSTGVFRVVATQDPTTAVTAIQEKLLGTFSAQPFNTETAPDPNLEAPQTGLASDLETRIDTLPPLSPSASTEAFAQLFRSANLDAVLTLSSAKNPGEKDGIWVPIHSAVVLHTASPTNPQTLATALQQTLRGGLTAGSFGINFQPENYAGTAIYTLAGLRPVFFAISSTPAQGNLILLADDRSLLLELLHNLAVTATPGGTPTPVAPTPATLIAVFNHATQRAPYLRLTSLIDGTNKQAHDSRTTAATSSDGNAQVTSTSTFFSRNIGSLSNTFATLQSERVVERTVDSNLRQTVTYIWQTP